MRFIIRLRHPLPRIFVTVHKCWPLRNQQVHTLPTDNICCMSLCRHQRCFQTIPLFSGGRVNKGLASVRVVCLGLRGVFDGLGAVDDFLYTWLENKGLFLAPM